MEKLTIVVPAYNEEEVLPDSVRTLLSVEDKLISSQMFDSSSDILIVDDGSTDDTWNIINEENERNKRITGIKFSRNFGHQNALIAGMTEAIKTADIVVTIDADLQDDPNAIEKMTREFLNGSDIVYGVWA